MQSIHVSHGSLLSNQTVISFKNPGDHFCCDFQLHPDYLCWMHSDFWKHNFFLLRGTCFLLSWRFHIFLSRTILCRGCFLCFCTFWNFLEFFGQPHFGLQNFIFSPLKHICILWCVRLSYFICFMVPWSHWRIQNARNMFQMFYNWSKFGSSNNFLAPMMSW